MANRCEFEPTPGVRCELVAHHDEPYYPYLDYGQWGEYSDILSEGWPHVVHWPAQPLPPREQWTGNERKDTDHSTWREPVTASRDRQRP
jgi:hypothetical protein